MTVPPVIGLSGYARSGKDTVAQILHKLYGYEPVSFSDALNRALMALNPVVVHQPEPGINAIMTYQEAVGRLGYEGAKEIPEVRRLLQAMGTEVGRNMFGENVWVDALFSTFHLGRRYAISNVRFPNEYDAVKNNGGIVIRVERPGFDPVNAHPSETALDDHEFDVYIQNIGSLQDLAITVTYALEFREATV